ncbi:AbrB/MazE/SpoVT family DNA-binding domain-containing protein [Burkholderia multivorans]|uniref:AbrB/MazE/SpoVT family DNA-binding domain-containing protein n=2 Tax=Burkholderia multivorans TaxID=87883 RepID=UPI0032665FD8
MLSKVLVARMLKNVLSSGCGQCMLPAMNDQRFSGGTAMPSGNKIDIDIALRKIHELSMSDGDVGREYWQSIGRLLRRAVGIEAGSTAESHVNSRGQTTVPVEIRRALNWKPGTRLNWVILSDGCVSVSEKA